METFTAESVVRELIHIIKDISWEPVIGTTLHAKEVFNLHNTYVVAVCIIMLWQVIFQVVFQQFA